MLKMTIDNGKVEFCMDGDAAQMVADAVCGVVTVIEQFGKEDNVRDKLYMSACDLLEMARKNVNLLK